MKKSCHYGRTKWTAIFDGRSYIFMTTISMGEARGTLRPLAGFWFLNLICCGGSDVDSACFRPLAGFWFLNVLTNYWSTHVEEFPSPCGGPYLSFPRRYGGSGEHSEPMGAFALRALLML